MSVPHFTRPLILMPVVFGLGLWAGGSLFRESTAGDSPARISKELQARSPTRRGTHAAGIPIESAKQAAAPNLSGLSPLEARKVLDGITDSEVRKAAIRQCLAGMPREKWDDWFQASMKNENPNVGKADIAGMARRYTMLNEWMSSIAAIDPVGYMAIQNSKGQTNNDSESQSRLLTMMHWVEQDPAAARDFLTKQLRQEKTAAGLSDSVRHLAGIMIRKGESGVFEWAAGLPAKERAEATSAAISEIALTNPQDAAAKLLEFQKLPEMDTSSNRRWNSGNLSESITSQWAKTDPAAALAWAAAQSGAMRTKGMNGALSDWAKNDFDAALGAVRNLPPEAAAEGVGALIGKATPERLGEMAALVEQQPEGTARANASAEVMRAWTDKNPEQASQWMAKQPVGEVRDNAISAFVRWADVRDPEAGLLWAGSMSDAGKRMEAINHIVEQLGPKAPPVVQSWMDNHAGALTEAERGQILRKMSGPP